MAGARGACPFGHVRGYSRNARWKDSGERASNLATWGELHKRLCDDLQLDRSAFDAMTVADLYATRLGSGLLHNVLLALVPDENLVPADAHAALLSYDAEAIITTNHLDTLLDRDTSDWGKVVHDHDVAKFDPTRSNRRHVIYYHGHRHDFDSWVVRRTDYEDH